MDGRVYMNYVHSSTMLKQLTALWKNDLLCDAVLTVDNCIMARAHKILLLAMSPKLQSDSNSLSQTSFMDVQLPSKVSPQSVKAFLKYMYEGFLCLTENNIDDLQKIAVHLEMPSLYKCCKDFTVKTGMSNYSNCWKNPDKWANFIGDFSLDDFAHVRVMHDSDNVTKKSSTKSQVKECDSSKGQVINSKEIIDLCNSRNNKPQPVIADIRNNSVYFKGDTFHSYSSLSKVQRPDNASDGYKEMCENLKQKGQQRTRSHFKGNSGSKSHHSDNIQPSRSSGQSHSISSYNAEVPSNNLSSNETTIFDTHSGKTFEVPNLSSHSERDYSSLSDFSNMTSSSLLRKVLTEMPVSKRKPNPVTSSNVLSEILQADTVVPSDNNTQRQSNYDLRPLSISRPVQNRAPLMDKYNSSTHDEPSVRTPHGIQNEGKSLAEADKGVCVSASSLLRSIVECQYYGQDGGRPKDMSNTPSPKESSPGLVSILQKPPIKHMSQAHHLYTGLNDSNNKSTGTSDFSIKKESAEEPSSSDQLIPPVFIKEEPHDVSYEQGGSSSGHRFENTGKEFNTREERERMIGLYLSNKDHTGFERQPMERRNVLNSDFSVNDPQNAPKWHPPQKKDGMEEQSSSDTDFSVDDPNDDPEWHPSKKKRKKTGPSRLSYQFGE